MDLTTKKLLRNIHLSFVIFLLFVFVIQYFFTSPPDRDYFNVNLTVVSGVIIIFSLLLIYLAFYNSRKFKIHLDNTKDLNIEDLKEGHMLSWAPLAGACLFSQLVYFHIYGHWSLMVVSVLSLLILMYKRTL